MRAFLQKCDRDNIDLDLFTDDALEMQCESLSTEKESSKGDPDKSQDKPPVWDVNIYKLGPWLKRFYAWVGLKKNGKGVPLTWLLILKDTTLDADGNPIEGASFEEDPWSRRYRDSAPGNVKSWATSKPMTGPQYSNDSQELYNHLVGLLKGEPMTIVEKYLNDGHRAYRALLRQYMNPSQCRMMARAVREKLPTLKYYKESGKHGLKEHMAALSEGYASLEAAGVVVREEEKVLQLTHSIKNEKLATGAVSHIVASDKLSRSFVDDVAHLTTTALHLEITGPGSEETERGRSNISDVTSGRLE